MPELAYLHHEDPAIRDQLIKDFETVQAELANYPDILATVGRDGDAFACVSLDCDPSGLIEQVYMSASLCGGSEFLRFTP